MSLLYAHPQNLLNGVCKYGFGFHLATGLYYSSMLYTPVLYRCTSVAVGEPTTTQLYFYNTLFNTPASQWLWSSPTRAYSPKHRTSYVTDQQNTLSAILYDSDCFLLKLKTFTLNIIPPAFY